MKINFFYSYFRRAKRSIVNPLHQQYVGGKLLFLLVTLFALLLIYPFFADSASGPGFLVTVLTLAVLATVSSVGFTRVRLFLFMSVALPLLVTIWDDPFAETNILDPVPLFFLLLFLLLAIIYLIDALRKSRQVGFEELYGAVAIYLLLGFSFGAAFLLIESITPLSFALNGELARLGWSELTYFGFVSLATIGFGDITPVAPFTRNISVLAGLVGNLYIAVVIARFASLMPRNHRASARTVKKKQ